MKTNYQLFVDIKKKNLDKIKTDYANKLFKARNKEKANYQFYDDLFRNKYTETQNELGEYSRFFISIRDEISLDETKSFELVFNVKAKEIPTRKRKNIIKLLSELDAMDDFFEFWNHQNENNKEEYNIKLNEKIIWKGTNETEFVQLIYMLYHSMLLTNEKDEIGLLVNQMAAVFNLQIRENWQSNLSASVNKRKQGYKPEIISKLNKAWESYVEKKIMNKRKN
jgi:hypothetical protein